jgi:hypothetical protein
MWECGGGGEKVMAVVGGESREREARAWMEGGMV